MLWIIGFGAPAGEDSKIAAACCCWERAAKNTPLKQQWNCQLSRDSRYLLLALTACPAAEKHLLASCDALAHGTKGLLKPTVLPHVHLSPSWATQKMCQVLHKGTHRLAGVGALHHE